MKGGHPAAGRLCSGVFLICAAGYLVTANGHLQGPDQEYFYRMAQSIALRQSFAIEPLGAGDGGPGARGVDGRYYAQYAPGLPLALAPLVLLGHAVADPFATLLPYHRWSSPDSRDVATRFIVSYFNVPVTAATAALVARLVLQLGYSPGAATFTAFAFAFASPAWGQARSIFAEPLQALLLLTACLLLLKATPVRALLGGTALAAAALVKLTSFLAVPALLLLPDGAGRTLWRNRPILVLVLIPVVIGLLMHGLYNYGRFGNPFTTAYTTGGGRGLDFAGNLLVGGYGLLFSPGRGLFNYAPALLASVWAYWPFRKQHPSVALAIGILTLLWLVLHALWRDWDAGWGWGPRYLIPLLPLVLGPLALCWRDPRSHLPALGLVAVGVAIQVPGATVDFMESGAQALSVFMERCLDCSMDAFREWWFFNPANSDIFGHTALLLAGKHDLAWLHFSDTWVLPLTLSLALILFLAGVILLVDAAGRLEANRS